MKHVPTLAELLRADKIAKKKAAEKKQKDAQEKAKQLRFAAHAKACEQGEIARQLRILGADPQSQSVVVNVPAEDVAEAREILGEPPIMDELSEHREAVGPVMSDEDKLPAKKTVKRAVKRATDKGKAKVVKRAEKIVTMKKTRAVGKSTATA